MISKINIRDRRLLGAGLFLLLLFLYSPQKDYSYTGRLNDDARHIICAQALLKGHYRDISRPDPPPITNQLPGYPLLIAPAFAFGGEPAVKNLSILFTACAAVFILFVFGSAGAAALLFALHPMSLTISGTAMTEPAYLFWTLGTLLLISKKGPDIIVILLCAFAAWIRPQGALFAISVLLFYPETTNKRKTFLGILALTIISFPYLRNFLIAGTGASYFAELATSKTAFLHNLFSEAVSNAFYYFYSVPLFCAGTQSPKPYLSPAINISAIIFWVIFARGISRTLKNGKQYEKIASVYTVLMLCAHLLWVNQSVRYVYAILPFIYFCAFKGIEDSAKSLKAILISLVAISMLPQDILIIKSSFKKTNPDRFPPGRIISWVKSNTVPDDIFMATYSHRVYHLTGRKTFGYYFSPDPDNWYRALLGMNIKYIWLDNSTPLIANTPARENAIGKAFGFIKKQVSDRARFRQVCCDGDTAISIYMLNPDATVHYKTLNKAFERINRNDFKTAERILRGLKLGNAPITRLDFLLGTTLMIEGKNTQAKPFLETALKKEPEFQAAKQNLCAVYSATGNKKAASLIGCGL